jgi:hypothetical protein
VARNLLILGYSPGTGKIGLVDRKIISPVAGCPLLMWTERNRPNRLRLFQYATPALPTLNLHTFTSQSNWLLLTLYPPSILS